MKLLKVKGVVIKEVPYKDNDKIITLMTDKLGKISCMAKGAKKTTSALLASCQLLVFSEFVLYKGTSFYHINSAETIDTFYSLRTDYDKLEKAYEVTKVLNSLVVESEDTEAILSLYLNSLYVISKNLLKFDYVMSIFKLKMLVLLGYSPNIVACSNCSKRMLSDENIGYYYSFNTNSILCGDCYNKLKKENSDRIKGGWYISLSMAAFYGIAYIVASETKKVFSFKVDDKALQEIVKIADRLYLEQLSY